MGERPAVGGMSWLPAFGSRGRPGRNTRSQCRRRPTARFRRGRGTGGCRPRCCGPSTSSTDSGPRTATGLVRPAHGPHLVRTPRLTRRGVSPRTPVTERSDGGGCQPARFPFGPFEDAGRGDPPYARSASMPSRRNRGRAILSAGGVCLDSALQWWRRLFRVFPAGDSESGSVSAPSLVTPTRRPRPGIAWFPLATLTRGWSLPAPPHTASRPARLVSSRGVLP